MGRTQIWSQGCLNAKPVRCNYTICVFIIQCVGTWFQRIKRHIQGSKFQEHGIQQTWGLSVHLRSQSQWPHFHSFVIFRERPSVQVSLFQGGAPRLLSWAADWSTCSSSVWLISTPHLREKHPGMLRQQRVLGKQFRGGHHVLLWSRWHVLLSWKYFPKCS